MIDSTKLIDLAARGIPAQVIANALGISESRISQLLGDERVASRVAALQAEIATEEIDTIISLEKLERSLLGKIGDLVEDTDSLAEATGAYERIHKIHAQKQGRGQVTDEGIRTILVETPIFLQQTINIATSGKGEIISINDKPMATMPTLAVHKLIKATAEAKQDDYQDTDTGQAFEDASVEF